MDATSIPWLPVFPDGISGRCNWYGVGRAIIADGSGHRVMSRCWHDVDVPLVGSVVHGHGQGRPGGVVENGRSPPRWNGIIPRGLGHDGRAIKAKNVA